ncbi:2-dehydropantoate 2-reductase [Virgibacillus sp. NKC19-3]|uniref:ketopantoate reductase family protein n=1 Tax=Virgibacillus saliphilus TaxID=2831674 RepID=UPI001C9BB1FC|nr:2-dehydropantoate 2-reductase [Virgibacillus sp. NKC19-3]MBY7145032.1 2-dehydropantoate 2-reductase [Virgibacillus sp. NKC19-3]
MRIVVIGAGALGVYFGARWIEAGEDVTFLVREKRAAQIREHGIKINSPYGDYIVENPKIVTDPGEIEAVDLVFVSVKGYHLQGTLEHLEALTAKGAYVLPVLNGMEHIRILQDTLGKASVIGGLSFIFATLNEQGHVVHSGDAHQLIFGPLEDSQKDLCRQIEEIAEPAVMDSRNSMDISWELWRKYMFINALSGVTTATNLTIGPIRENEETFHIVEMLLHEMKLLANRYDARLTDAEVEAAKQNISKLDPDATSSMHKDRRKGLTLEVDHLHAGAVRLAEAVDLDVPYIRAILGVIKPFENA